MDFFGALSTAQQPEGFPTDLFDTRPTPEARHVSLVPPAAETPPAANNDNNGDTEALVAIVDLLLDLWREATGEDLRPSIFEAQNL